MSETRELRELLIQGAEALLKGRREEARDFLLAYVEQYDQNPEAWLWLSGAVDEDDDIRVALENCLALDPQNERAHQGLKWLEQKSAPGN